MEGKYACGALQGTSGALGGIDNMLGDLSEWHAFGTRSESGGKERCGALGFWIDKGFSF